MKKTAKISPRLNKVPEFNPFEVEFNISPDDPLFIPVQQEDGSFDLVANCGADVHGVKRNTITSRVIQKIDCGFSIDLPRGYYLIIESLPEHTAKGLIVQSAISEQRVGVWAHNLGKEIIVINNGEKIAKMHVLCSYNAKLKVKEKKK